MTKSWQLQFRNTKTLNRIFTYTSSPFVSTKINMHHQGESAAKFQNVKQEEEKAVNSVETILIACDI
jgi:hypothetical protein